MHIHSRVYAAFGLRFYVFLFFLFCIFFKYSIYGLLVSFVVFIAVTHPNFIFPTIRLENGSPGFVLWKFYCFLNGFIIVVNSGAQVALTGSEGNFYCYCINFNASAMLWCCFCYCIVVYCCFFILVHTYILTNHYHLSILSADAPTIRLIGSPEIDLEEDKDALILRCVADANPPASIVWRRAGRSEIASLQVSTTLNKTKA